MKRKLIFIGDHLFLDEIKFKGIFRILKVQKTVYK